jgi:hypothetical protein
MSFALRLVAFIIGIIGLGLWVLTKLTGSLEESTSVNFAAVLVIGLAGLSVLLIVLFGIRSLSFGKVKVTTLLLIAIPAVAVVICMLLGSSLDPNNPYSAGALLAMFVVFVLAIGGVALSGVKSMFGI